MRPSPILGYISLRRGCSVADRFIRIFGFDVWIAVFQHRPGLHLARFCVIDTIVIGNFSRLLHKLCQFHAEGHTFIRFMFSAIQTCNSTNSTEYRSALYILFEVGTVFHGTNNRFAASACCKISAQLNILSDIRLDESLLQLHLLLFRLFSKRKSGKKGRFDPSGAKHHLAFLLSLVHRYSYIYYISKDE
ncbi:MAG: hypothetical protein IJC48_07760 [Clostridia bacterium]|nr:hypothetical protein [Clostridia bacterium]